MINRIIFFGILLLALSCDDSAEKITDADDYDIYLSNEDSGLQLTNSSQIFWENKLKQNPDQFPYHLKLANVHNQLFTTTGDISHLIEAESHLVKANEVTDYDNASYLRALAYNYISQHRFKEALRLLDKAELIGDNLVSTEKMKFDVLMELGNYDVAKLYLEKIQDISDFDYLIRVAKWNDHKGNLEAAIKYMEKASVLAEESNLPSKKQWVYTNLADFYGHAGQIDNSYSFYLKALEIDPSDAYAKKGIAWIVFSYERNPKEAYRILEHIALKYQSPDILLLMSEIAAFQEQSDLEKQHLESYAEAIDNGLYGEMYNGQKISLYAEDFETPDKAVELASREVNNRPTPEAYALLAWSHFKNNNPHLAADIIKNHVHGKTYEPQTLYYTAEIYKAVGNKIETKNIKKELLASLYELGPSMEPKLKAL